MSYYRFKLPSGYDQMEKMNTTMWLLLVFLCCCATRCLACTGKSMISEYTPTSLEIRDSFTWSKLLLFFFFLPFFLWIDKAFKSCIHLNVNAVFILIQSGGIYSKVLFIGRKFGNIWLCFFFLLFQFDSRLRCFYGTQRNTKGYLLLKNYTSCNKFKFSMSFFWILLG